MQVPGLIMKKKTNENALLDAQELKAFGERLKEVREQMRLKQNMMAPELGVSASSLSSIEKGKSKPSFDVLKNIYKEFDISINFLLDGCGEALINKEKTEGIEIDDNSPENERLRELLFYVENAPRVKYALFEFLSNYLFNNKEAIKEDMEKHRKFLERIKHNIYLKKEKFKK